MYKSSYTGSQIDDAVTKANAAAPQSTTYTKSETDTLIAKKPGEITTGKQYTIDGQTVTAGTGAEAFNDLTNNKAAGSQSHAEGAMTTASGSQSHAEGAMTTASGSQSHAEGVRTTASGSQSHAEGGGTTASGSQSHAEGSGTTASGINSHAEGALTKASSNNQHVQGKYNVEDANDTYAFIIGNGTANNARHNAFAIDWNGLIYVNGAATGVDVSALAPQSTAYTKTEVDAALAAKLNTSDVDTALSSTSANPVQNKAVYEEVKKKASLEDILGVGAAIANNANMNSLTDIGKWYCVNGTTAATVTNAPFNDAAYFGWTIRSVASSDRYVQIAIKNSDTFEIAKRRYSGTWSAWSYLASTAVT